MAEQLNNMQKTLGRLQRAFGQDNVRVNPEKLYEEVLLHENMTRASRVIINQTIVDLLEQNGVMSVWVDRHGSRKHTDVTGVIVFVQDKLGVLVEA